MKNQQEENGAGEFVHSVRKDVIDRARLEVNDGPVRAHLPLKYRIIEDQQVNFTPKKAGYYLELERFADERPWRESHTKELAIKMRTGEFLWQRVEIVLCRNKADGLLYRLNGQHTSWAVLLVDQDVLPSNAKIREVTYEVENEAYMRALYTQLDRNLGRTPSQVLKNLILGSKETVEKVWTSIVANMAAGFHLWKYPNHRIACEQIAAMIVQEYSDLFRNTSIFYQENTKEFSFLRRAGVIGAMLETHSAGPTKFEEFWTPVCSGIGLPSKEDARWATRRFLETHTNGRMPAPGYEMASPEDMYRICVLGWNKWRRNEKCLTTLRSSNKRAKAI